MKKRIGVIGSDGKIPAYVERISECIGTHIAKNGCILICGGRGGVMEACARAARKEKGTVVGILPTLDKKEANAYVDIPITTGLSHARNALVVACSDAVIVVNGRVGTLSEIGLALCYDRPVIAVKGSGGVADSVEEKIKDMGIVNKVYTTKAENAVPLALSLIK